MKKIILSLVCVVVMTVSAFANEPTAADVMRATPKYENVEDVLNVIVAQHPGKVVFVDLWATWCGPCIMAMRTMEPLKGWMAEQDIVKVYISAPTSDRARWESMIGDIGGNHYWFNEEEWAAVREKYPFRGIPTYMIFDREGNHAFQRSGYPGNEQMQAEFEKLL
ncbi:MAG: TlpA family protein disulfide reductase [Rikenellaceae bacterium]|nr:TlpA family protein disulfide reductase [Rikenellaceae bacterium]MCL2693142.1 TlpA family protein disulfide reductase [Rikenellaceae bacterium]